MSHLTSIQTFETETFTLSKLARKYPGGIRIPIIQRDYAQGRKSWENLRKRFLKDIREAMIPGGEPLHLDFVYGMMQDEDGIGAFSPLDGQQRLTTLFLLHWYLAGRDDCFEQFQTDFQTAAKTSKFTYQVRPGGRSFFQALVKYKPATEEYSYTKPAAWIQDQPWFRTIWERDPSVAGALVMLDAIHEHFFNTPEASYNQLATCNRVTFQMLDLEAAGLHDDLYLRMNARGRPLSSFETFKARYENFLKTTFPKAAALERCTVKTAKDFSDRIDKEWLDFIWHRYGSENSASEDTSFLDEAFMNLFRATALASLPPSSDTETKEVAAITRLSKEKPDYDDFEVGGWLTPLFTTHLIHVLESLSGADAEMALNLFGSRRFNGSNVLDRIVRHDGNLTLTDFLQFAACVRFITRHGPLLDETKIAVFQDWIRVVRNLVTNSSVEAKTFRSISLGLDQLLEGSENILQFLSGSEKKFTGFNANQTKEELLKATLWLAHEDWKDLIEQAENHAYFRGQIGFLLDFSGAETVSKSDYPQDHLDAQNLFRNYSALAETMFGENGLRERPENNDYLWQRALLAVGNYLLKFRGHRWSFLNPEGTGNVSWKRFLRDDHGGKRRHLKKLWDHLDLNSVETSLKAVLVEVTIEEPWRKTFCSTREVWDYCKNRMLQFGDRDGKPPRVFLLSGKTRGSDYEELNSFAFRHKLERSNNKPSTDTKRFHPFEYIGSGYVASSYHPHLKFEFNYQGKTYVSQLYCHCGNDSGFSLRIPGQDIDPDFENFLREASFKPEDEPSWQPACLTKHQDPADPLDGAAFLDSIAEAFRQVQSPS